MATHDYVIANQGFPAFRSDLNNALAAIVSNNSSATEPTTMFAHMIWVDTAADPSILKIRNADNDAWITIGTINQTADTFKLTPAGGISTDTIAELTSAAGVTIDSVLLKDGGVTVSDGTVSAPTVTNTGDTNTGVYFPAADQVAIAAGGSVAAAFNSHQFMGMRNRIINGDMRIAQRGTSFAISDATATFTVDRWRIFENTDGAFTLSQDTTAPVGFQNSLKVLVTTADASVTSAQLAYVSQFIEGFNVADLGWGAAGAKTVTLSFWVRSSVTGTFGGGVINGDNNRSYPFTYAISVADTWEYKTVTIDGDTSGTWVTNSGVGLRLMFSMGSGSNFQGTAGQWNAAEDITATGETALVNTLNATWYVTGVQLEVGSVATPFERRPYGTELSLCQRYYQVIDLGDQGVMLARPDSAGSGVPLGGYGLLNAMRAAPTVAFSAASGGSLGPANLVVNVASTSFVSVYNDSSVSAGVIVGMRATCAMSAEL